MSNREYSKGRSAQIPLFAGKVADRLDEVEAIARATGSQCRTRQQLRDLALPEADCSIAAIVYPGTLSGAAELIDSFDQAGIGWRVIGYDTKLATGDSMNDFVAVSLRLLDEPVIFDEDLIRVHAGYALPDLVGEAAERGLSGLECLAGVFGTVGAALLANTGMPGCEIWRVTEDVLLADGGAMKWIPEPGDLIEIAQAYLTDRDLILAATLRLVPRDPVKVKAETQRYLHSRKLLRVGGPASPGYVMGYEVDAWRDEPYRDPD